MEKQNIFKKIDALYTKVTKVIIGEVPHDGDEKIHATTNKKNASNSTIQQVRIKDTFLSLKDRFLALGQVDEKALLYKEVVKREKQEAKELIKAKKEAKKIINTKKKDAQASAKKKTTSKNYSNQKATDKKTANKPNIKKITAKKSIVKEPSIKKTPTKSTTKKTSTKITKPTKISAKSTIEQKNTVNKIPLQKIVTKKSTTPKGAKKAAKIALYIKDIKKHYGEVDEDFVAIIVKNLGPSIYKKDAELVSCSDSKELDTVRRNFLIKKLGIDASKSVLDAAIQDVCQELKGVRNKYRATFYYSLAKKFKKEPVLS